MYELAYIFNMIRNENIIIAIEVKFHAYINTHQLSYFGKHQKTVCYSTDRMSLEETLK